MQLHPYAEAEAPASIEKYTASWASLSMAMLNRNLAVRPNLAEPHRLDWPAAARCQPYQDPGRAPPRGSNGLTTDRKHCLAIQGAVEKNQRKTRGNQRDRLQTNSNGKGWAVAIAGMGIWGPLRGSQDDGILVPNLGFSALRT
jgi:hypothetical protein